MNNEAIKSLTIAFTGLTAIVYTSIPFAFVLCFAILLDCLSAFDLSRRLKAKYPERVTGKFKSEYAMRMLRTFFEMYSVIILVCFVEVYVIPMHHFYLANYTSAIFCAIQLWSILENISSENDKSWAKKLQKIMVNKAKRHFDIDLSSEEKEGNNDGSK